MTGRAMTPALALENISCTFVSRNDPSQRYTAVGGTTFVVGEGEFVSVVGPTGCGKTTLLNVAAGLLQPSSGTVTVLGAPLAGINSHAGYMFQTEALMPWRNTIENVVAGLEFRGVAREDADPQSADPAHGRAVFGARRSDAAADGERAARAVVRRPQVGGIHHPRSRGGDFAIRQGSGAVRGPGVASDRRLCDRPAAPARCRRNPPDAALHRNSHENLARDEGRGAERLCPAAKTIERATAGCDCAPSRRCSPSCSSRFGTC